MESTKAVDYSKTPLDLILTNSPAKAIQVCVTEMELSDHELIYRSRKTLLFKLNEHREISFSSMKNYSDKISKEKLRSIEFPDYSNHISVNDVY